jgi:hypothetical protein
MNALADDGRAWSAEFARRSRPFRVRWRRSRLLGRFLGTLWLPLLAGLTLYALLRFTLLDLPDDTPLLWLIAPLWLAGLGLTYLLDRPSAARLARVVDRELDLDERLSSAVAMAGLPGEGPDARLLRRLRLDALDTLEERGEDPRAFKPRLRLPRAALPLAAALLVAGPLLSLIPSPVAGPRAERAALRVTAAAQANRLAQTRREAVPRPELAPPTRDLLDAQLAAAERALREHPADRAANVAALSQAEETLRSALPDNAGAVSAARRAAGRSIEATLAALRGDNPPQGGSELERAAAAAEAAPEGLTTLADGATTARLSAAGGIDQAAAALDATDPALAAKLRQSSKALRDPKASASQALRDLAAALRQAAQEQAASDVLANALSQLGDSKQLMAQAGLSSAAASADGATPGALGRLGKNPDGAQSASDAAPGAGAGSGPAQPNQPGSARDANPGDDTPPDAGSAASASAPGANRVSGAVQGGAGTQNGSAGQQGTGDGRRAAGVIGAQKTDSSPEESVYVPEGALPAADPNARQDRVAGVLSPGSQPGESTTVHTSDGYNPGVKTPFTRVVGQYRDAAAQALDRSYIPSDAKQYVRDYFDSIAPTP